MVNGRKEYDHTHESIKGIVIARVAGSQCGAIRCLGWTTQYRTGSDSDRTQVIPKSLLTNLVSFEWRVFFSLDLGFVECGRYRSRFCTLFLISEWCAVVKCRESKRDLAKAEGNGSVWLRVSDKLKEALIKWLTQPALKARQRVARGGARSAQPLDHG
jgi:hypothetical protein